MDTILQRRDVLRVLCATACLLVLANCEPLTTPTAVPSETAGGEGRLACMPDCSNANLVGASLSGVDLREINLSYASLAGADLRNSDLDGANLRGADLRGATLISTTLRGADLSGADLAAANLDSADLSGAILRGVGLTGANLRGATLVGADLHGADLTDADLQMADLIGVDLSVVQGCDVSGRLLRCLLGTWRTTFAEGYREDDELVGDTRATLTFTRERWISYVEQVLFDGTVVNSWSDSGGWGVSDSAITRKWIDGDPPVEATNEHDYYLVDGDVLIVSEWAWSPGYDYRPDLFRYERLENALPDLVGTWVRPIRPSDDIQLTITLRADGTFRYHSLNPQSLVDNGEWDFVMEGKWSHDAGNLYLPLSEISATDFGEAQPNWWAVELGARFAYAPMGDGGILVSGWWNEPPSPNIQGQHPWLTYGGYYSRFYRQEDQE